MYGSGADHKRQDTADRQQQGLFRPLRLDGQLGVGDDLGVRPPDIAFLAAFLEAGEKVVQDKPICLRISLELSQGHFRAVHTRYIILQVP